MSDARTTTPIPRRVRWAVALGGTVLRALARTWRMRRVNDAPLHALRERGQPVIFALWHGEMLPLLWCHRREGVSILISEHADGEIIARTAESLGYRTVRGSTTRGADRALLGLCRVVESGGDIAITPDGPRGPAHRCAPGVLIVAQRTRAPIIPIVAVASGVWRFRSWDGFIIPKPFARVTVSYGPPMLVCASTPREAAADAPRLEQLMHKAAAVAGDA
ncbi:MAG TPA: lysophospholipid acyltransferase family protein [Gemmatimonadaceae bacterium]|nr:lysophospholipid acyltransferase family protein [Gemmatimonadaceae bacterium]